MDNHSPPLALPAMEERELALEQLDDRSSTDPMKVVHGRSIRFATCTPTFFATVDQLVHMARHDVTLLLVGETGTGKTTAAKLVHELSPRWDEPLVTIACGALPPDLIESELFGHVRGAFTGADRDKPGKFAAAAHGTLLLDEIDVLTLDQQAKLLRVIETGEYEPVGSNDTKRSSARLIAASNQDLKQLLFEQRFREDLYYRLNVLEFRLPPLRERPLDIEHLTRAFVDEFRQTHHVAIQRIHPLFFDKLCEFAWPGNIRELKNHVRRAVLFCQTGELTPNDLALDTLEQSSRPWETPHPPHPPHPAVDPRGRPASPASASSALDQSLSAQVATSEREILEAALAEHNQNRTRTAEHLGISRVGLYKKMRRLGMLPPARTRSKLKS